MGLFGTSRKKALALADEKAKLWRTMDADKLIKEWVRYELLAKNIDQADEKKHLEYCSYYLKVQEVLKEKYPDTFYTEIWPKYNSLRAEEVGNRITEATKRGEIFLDDTTTATKERSVIKDAVVGGVIAGPAGAVVGALNAVDKNNKTRSK